MIEVSKDHVKKIAVILPSLPIGGAERLVFEELIFLRHDPRFHFEIHVVFEPGYLHNKFKELGIPIYVWNAPHKSPCTLITFLKIVFYLRRKRFDIIRIHLMDYLCPFMKILTGMTVIITIHQNITYSLIERFCLRHSDLLFACGDQVMKNLRGFISPHKLRLLTNAVQPAPLNCTQSENILQRLSICTDNIVLSLGRLTWVKGYDLLIEAFRTVVEKTPNVVLLIGGAGPDREILERQITTTGMQKHIHLLGLVDDVNELMKNCDVYVNASRKEGLPLTLLEAMAHGKPIVATNVGSNCEVVKNEETGLLVDPERPDLLAKAILRLLNDKELRDTLKTQSFELFKKNYTIEKHCETLAEEYLAC